MSKKYTVSFKIETLENIENLDSFEAQLKDIVKSVVASTFNFEISPLSFTVKKARN